MADYPPNIEEFNQAAGLVFGQLYQAFPVPRTISRQAIGLAFGADGAQWDQYKLRSGRTAGEMTAHTIVWLQAEGYIRSNGDFPGERATLTTKGLVAMNAVPEGLGQPVGAELTKVSEGSTFDLSKLGDLVGGFFGGYTKSMGSG